jgi:hypothetical protein
MGSNGAERQPEAFDRDVRESGISDRFAGVAHGPASVCQTSQHWLYAVLDVAKRGSALSGDVFKEYEQAARLQKPADLVQHMRVLPETARVVQPIQAHHRTSKSRYTQAAKKELVRRGLAGLSKQPGRSTAQRRWYFAVSDPGLAVALMIA